MWAKLLLGALFVSMVALALRVEPARDRSLLATRPSDGPRLKLMTWNVGQASASEDSRARAQDLPAVAATILRHSPDAVALQELSGPDQLAALTALLRGRYRGEVCRPGRADRVEAVLVRGAGARFEEIPAGERYALGAIFRPHPERPEVVLVSAHADAFTAARRRSYTGEVVDWARSREGAVVFVAGDFNFEVGARSSSYLFTDNLKHDSEAYSYLLKYFRDLGRDAGETAPGDRRIDYIFGPPETALLRRAEVLQGAAVGRMDHWPLLVEVAL